MTPSAVGALAAAATHVADDRRHVIWAAEKLTGAATIARTGAAKPLGE
jgi:hypothetical protein